MSNTYFQFKEFIVHQEHCAMKVCTDACLFGAWVATKVKTKPAAIKNCLDIGTGTGLLSLMLAQQSDAHIDAVELDETAAEQAADNFELSPWKDRLQVLQGDIRKIHLGRKYDLIISNPPFFGNNLKSPDSKRNLALHSEMLELEELIGIVNWHLLPGGSFAVLLPYERKENCIITAAAAGLYPAEMISVKQSTKHGFFRVMFWFTNEPGPTTHTELSIRDGEDYSVDFKTLLAPYYLNL
jgi:tRNA1Val (adenine37-N6)-methyltransferase